MAPSGFKTWRVTLCRLKQQAKRLSANSFGPVQILLVAEQATPPILEAWAVNLCGLQLGLVDDHIASQTASPGGQQPGDRVGEAQEVITVDFLRSPRNHAQGYAVLADEARARRMAPFEIVNYQRPFISQWNQAPPNVLHPQMPMWMGFCEIVGINQQQLERMSARRYRLIYSDLRDPPATTDIVIDLDWKLTLSWRGPDANSAEFGPGAANQILNPGNHYTYPPNVFAPRDVVAHGPNPPGTGGSVLLRGELHFDREGHLSNAAGVPIVPGAHGEVPDALNVIISAQGVERSTVPATPAFPVAGRRTPLLIVSGRPSPWGRHAGATVKDALAVEFQPWVVKPDGSEVIRGGDGVLEMLSAKINRRSIRDWAPPEPAGAAPAPDMRLPRFRVRSRTNPIPGGPVIPGGDRIPIAQAEAVVEALVDDYFNDPRPDVQGLTHGQRVHVALLALACWRTTAVRIFRHENRGGRPFYRQFYEGRADRVTYDRNHPVCHLDFGIQGGMPLFGPPHGYGFGQLDEPVVTEDQAWSLIENIRECVRRIFEMYGLMAYQYLTGGQAGGWFWGLAQSNPHRQRAIFQRELVRRYNVGPHGHEFSERHFPGDPNPWQWVVHTTVTQAPLIDYPTRVLGTQVNEQGWTQFDQPVMYGPDTGVNP